MDEDKQGRMLGTKDVVSVSRKTDAVVSSIVGAPQDTVRKIHLEPESEAKMSLHQKSIPESPSSPVSPQKGVTSRPADESLESLTAPYNTKAWLDASVSHSKTQPSTRSVRESKQTSRALPSTLLFPNNKDSSPTQDLFGVHQAECINLISHAGENASSQKSVENSSLQPPSHMKVGRWDSEVRKVAVTSILPSAPSVASTEDQLVGCVAPPEELVPYSVSPNDTRAKKPGRNVHSQRVDKNESQVTSSLGVEENRISGQILWPQSIAETDGTAVCQRPLNYAEVNEEHPLANCLFAPASPHYGWCNHTVNDTHRQVSSSAEAVNATPESNTSGVFHVNQISAGQEAKGFDRLGSQTPPGGIGLEVQQQQMQQQMQQILQLLHQQQLLQQQLQCQIQQQQMHQFQMQKPQMHQVPQYQMYQQQSNQEQVQQQHPMQPLIQYQIYQHQMQQQIHPNEMYWQQQNNQARVQQHYGQSSTGTIMTPNQSNLPLPAQANVEYDIHRISPAQRNENLVLQNISPFGHVEHYPSPSTTSSMPAANRQDISHMPFSANHQH